MLKEENSLYCISTPLHKHATHITGENFLQQIHNKPPVHILITILQQFLVDHNLATNKVHFLIGLVSSFLSSLAAFFLIPRDVRLVSTRALA